MNSYIQQFGKLRVKAISILLELVLELGWWGCYYGLQYHHHAQNPTLLVTGTGRGDGVFGHLFVLS